MFQFGEILTLAISAIAAIFLLINGRRILATPNLRPFVLPLILMIVSWIATVVEGIFLPLPANGWVVVMQESVGLAADEPLATTVCNFVEHISTVAAAILLLVAVLRLAWARGEDRR